MLKPKRDMPTQRLVPLLPRGLPPSPLTVDDILRRYGTPAYKKTMAKGSPGEHYSAAKQRRLFNDRVRETPEQRLERNRKRRESRRKERRDARQRRQEYEASRKRWDHPHFVQDENGVKRMAMVPVNHWAIRQLREAHKHSSVAEYQSLQCHSIEHLMPPSHWSEGMNWIREMDVKGRQLCNATTARERERLGIRTMKARAALGGLREAVALAFQQMDVEPGGLGDDLPENDHRAFAVMGSYLRTKDEREQMAHIDHDHLYLCKEENKAGRCPACQEEGKRRSNACKCHYRHRMPYSFVMPLMEHGSWLLVWESMPLDYQWDGKSPIVQRRWVHVHIPMGYVLVIRGDVIHAGGLIQPDQRYMGQKSLRYHGYIYPRRGGSTHFANPKTVYTMNVDKNLGGSGPLCADFSTQVGQEAYSSPRVRIKRLPEEERPLVLNGIPP